MTAWVISIGGEYPDHLDLALEDGFWDTRKFRRIMQGDEVFFWQSKDDRPAAERRKEVVSELKAHVVATTDLVRIESDFRPGRWRDRRTGEYKFRFAFTDALVPPSKTTRWKDVQLAIGKPQPNRSITEIRSRKAINLLTDSFSRDWASVDVTFGRFGPAPEISDQTDRRAHALRSVAKRQGQGVFRAHLLEAYKRRCAFSRTVEGAVLEAAHIFPYRGDHSHHVTNGILLRPDLHSLFDSFLLAVDRSYRIRVADSVTEKQYRKLDGRMMLLPDDPAAWPAEEALADHWRDCKAFLRSEFGR